MKEIKLKQPEICPKCRRKQFSQQIKNLRSTIAKERGWHCTQKELAVKLGVSRDAIARIETGILDLSQKMRDRIKEVYGVEL